jgi:hypothetical protein
MESAGIGDQRGDHAFDGRIAKGRSGEHLDVSVRGHSGEPTSDHSRICDVAQGRHERHAQAAADEAADDVVVVAPIAHPRLEACLGADPLKARGARGTVAGRDPHRVLELVETDLCCLGQRMSGGEDQDQVFAGQGGQRERSRGSDGHPGVAIDQGDVEVAVVDPRGELVGFTLVQQDLEGWVADGQRGQR